MTQDLTTAFGEPAGAALRGLLPPRPSARPAEPADEPSADPIFPADADEAADADADEAADAEAADRPDRPGPASNGAGIRVPAPRRGTAPLSASGRRWGAARVTSREHVDLLVLTALAQGPAAGRDVVDRLRAESGGALAAPERTVHTTLHRLVRHRLAVRRSAAGNTRPRYELTDAGDRVRRARLREWRALTRAVEAVVRTDQQA